MSPEKTVISLLVSIVAAIPLLKLSVPQATHFISSIFLNVIVVFDASFYSSVQQYSYLVLWVQTNSFDMSFCEPMVICSSVGRAAGVFKKISLRQRGLRD